MTIEAFIIEYLAGALDVSVSGDVPASPPDQFVTVERTGGGSRDKLSSATIAVQSWAMSRADAADLNELVISAMTAMEAEPKISRCALDTSYNYTDVSRKRPRYQAVFDIVHYL